VKDGAAGNIFCKTIRTQVDADFHGMLGDKRHLVMGDVVMSSIGKADAKWLKGLRLKQFPNLFGCNHQSTIGNAATCFKCSRLQGSNSQQFVLNWPKGWITDPEKRATGKFVVRPAQQPIADGGGQVDGMGKIMGAKSLGNFHSDDIFRHDFAHMILPLFANAAE